MPLFNSGATTPAATSAAAYATFHTNARRASIREMGFFTQAATASSVSLGIAGNNATPPAASTSATPQAADVNTTSPDAAAVSRLDTAWSTAPTVPATFMRKFTLGAAVGQGVIFKLAPEERIILGQTTAQWLTFWNHGVSAGSALDMYVMHDE